MYEIKTKGATYTIPAKNVKLLALYTAIQRKANTPITDETSAIKYLESLGMDVEEV